MAPTPISIANTMARAMNNLYGTHIVINTSQFYGGEGKLVRMYIVKDAYKYSRQYANKELFCSASGVYTCLFMRDLLYSFQGREIPHEENEGYINVRNKKNADGAIEYMKSVYLEPSRRDEDE